MEQSDRYVLEGRERKVYKLNLLDMKYLEETDVILNIKLLRDESGGIALVQYHYVENMLSIFGYVKRNPSLTPYDPSVKY